MKHATICQSLPLQTKSDIYAYSIIPLTNTSFLALRSDDKITAFSLDSAKPAILWTLDTSHGGTTQVLTKQIQNHELIITTGTDGSIKLWDHRIGNTTPSQTLRHSQAPILSLASHPSSTILAAGTELSGQDAVIQFWDLRSSSPSNGSSGLMHKYTESHSDDITTLHYNPANSSCLLSGSTDGLVNIYDTNIVDEDDAVFQVLNHASSIQHANFLQDDDDVVWALSSDEQLSLYKLKDPRDALGVEALGDDHQTPPSVCAFGDVRPVLECDYVVDVVNTENGPLVCAGSFSQNRLDLIPLRKTPAWEFRKDEAIRLEKDLGNELVRSVYIDHVTERVIAGSEDNTIRIWSQFS